MVWKRGTGRPGTKKCFSNIKMIHSAYKIFHPKFPKCFSPPSRALGSSFVRVLHVPEALGGSSVRVLRVPEALGSSFVRVLHVREALGSSFVRVFMSGGVSGGRMFKGFGKLICTCFNRGEVLGVSDV